MIKKKLTLKIITIQYVCLKMECHVGILGAVPILPTHARGAGALVVNRITQNEKEI